MEMSKRLRQCQVWSGFIMVINSDYLRGGDINGNE